MPGIGRSTSARKCDGSRHPLCKMRHYLAIPIRLYSRGSRTADEGGAMEPSAPPSSDEAKKALPSLAELFWAVLVMGATCFGGSMLGFIEEVFVHDKRWISGEDFFESLEMARVLPGSNAVNLTVLLAKRLGGASAAALAFVAVITPAIAANCVMGALIIRFSYSQTLTNIVAGFGAAAVGLAAGAGVPIVRSGVRGIIPALIAFAAFVAVTLFHVNVLVALLIFGVPPILVYRYLDQRRAA